MPRKRKPRKTPVREPTPPPRNALEAVRPLFLSSYFDDGPSYLNWTKTPRGYEFQFGGFLVSVYRDEPQTYWKYRIETPRQSEAYATAREARDAAWRRIVQLADPDGRGVQLWLRLRGPPRATMREPNSAELARAIEAGKTLSLREAAKLAGVSMTAIGRAIKDGRLAAPKDDKGRLMIEPSELARVFAPQPPAAPSPDAAQAEDLVETPALPPRVSSSPRRSSARGPRLTKKTEAIGPTPQVRRV